jgi:hypothetical protein
MWKGSRKLRESFILEQKSLPHKFRDGVRHSVNITYSNGRDRMSFILPYLRETGLLNNFLNN